MNAPETRLGRGLASLINQDAYDSVTGNQYSRATKAMLLIPEFVNRFRVSLDPPDLSRDSTGLDEEILKCSAFSVAYRRELEKTNPMMEQQRWRELEKAIQAERTYRDAVVAEMTIREFRK